MTKNIENLRYMTDCGLELPADTGDLDSPFFAGELSPLGLKASRSFISGLRWEWEEEKFTLPFKFGVQAAYCSVGNLIVICASSSDACSVKNAVVFNSDGSINHEVAWPDEVEQVVYGLPDQPGSIEKYDAEGFWEVLIKDERVVLGVVFNYGWIERRFYDPITRCWQERDQIYKNL